MLEKLLKKPKSTREQYAFWGAVSTTGVIGLVWFLTLTISFQGGGPFAVEESQQTASAFSQFFGEVKDDFLESQAGQGEQVPPEEPVSTTTEGEVKEPASGTPVMIATSSPRAILVGTSSLQNR